jgi:hypothetical protein
VPLLNSTLDTVNNNGGGTKDTVSVLQGWVAVTQALLSNRMHTRGLSYSTLRNIQNALSEVSSLLTQKTKAPITKGTQHSYSSQPSPTIMDGVYKATATAKGDTTRESLADVGIFLGW